MLRRLLIALFSVLPLAAAAQDVSQEPIIRVSGSYTASSAPDRAIVMLGVVTEAPAAEDAARENAKKVEAVIQAIRKAFASNAKIETQHYNLSPKYSYPGQRGGERQLVGYTASNTIEVKTKKLDRTGEVLDLATKAGANNVEQLRFDLEDPEPLRAVALREATLRARAKAEAIARALDLRIRKISSVEEIGTSPAPIVRQRAATMAAEADFASTPVEPGTVEVRAQVTLTVEVGT